MDSVTANINKLVSLTFDERPEVRKQAAKSLSEINDPGAVFALVELSFDKDPSVREIAQQYLDKKKQTEPELMSFATIFSSPEKKEGEEEAPADAKEKMLRPITQIFEKRLGKEKADIAKTKMMPTIDKIYLKVHQQHGSKKKNEEGGRKVMQEFLTNYLEVMSDLDRIGDGPNLPFIPAAGPQANQQQPSAAQDSRPGQAQALVHPPVRPAEEQVLDGELEEVGRSAEPPDKLSSEAASLEVAEIEEFKEREEIEHLPDTFFKKAYETMMLSEGDEDVMKQEMNRMIEDARREIGLAFRMAKKRFKEMNVTNITKIKDGMRNINTEILTAKTVENLEYQKTKKAKATATRVLVNDQTGNEGIIYLFDNRGALLQPGMRIKVVGGLAKTFEFSGETGLTLGKKGNVYIVL
ncbi:HEAT repeat domain-containing protein [Candidatus Micrarchaeota archaeon]|nr:HEAT repeat domain-containing protein [Candidatus Micrarchaeota archaeon]